MRHLLKSAHNSWYFLTTPDIFWNLLSYPVPSWLLLLSHDISWHLMIYPDISKISLQRHILKYPNVSWHLLTYCDISWKAPYFCHLVKKQTGADPSRCNSTNRQNTLIQQNCLYFWSNDAILIPWISWRVRRLSPIPKHFCCGTPYCTPA